MSDNAETTAPPIPALVRATESGDFFRGPLAGALRVLAILGALPVLACFRFAAGDIDQVRGPALLLSLASIIAAALAGQVLFGRARRVLKAPAARFPVVPAMRECIRALGEAAFIWSMTLSTAGLVTGVWAANELGGDAIPQVIALAIGFLVLGWMGLLLVHLSTELASALVEIANNTEGGIAVAASPTTERNVDAPTSVSPFEAAATAAETVRPDASLRAASEAPNAQMILGAVGAMAGIAAVVVLLAGPSSEPPPPEAAPMPEEATTGAAERPARPPDPRFDGFDAMSDANKLDLLKSVGAQVYGDNCAACHQAEGQGIEGVFPPLRDDPLVTAGTPGDHINVILKGMSGVTINGVAYSAAMAPWGQLSDEEIAAVATYTATAWGNMGPMIVPAQVAAAR